MRHFTRRLARSMYVNVINIHSRSQPMNFAIPRPAMLVPRPVWIFAILLGFYFWWPFGLAVLAYRLYTKRSAGGAGQWQFPDMMGRAARGFSYAAPSGNRAFDEYRSGKRCAGWRTSRRSSWTTSTVCARHGTGRSSSSSWPTAASARPARTTRPSNRG